MGIGHRPYNISLCTILSMWNPSFVLVSTIGAKMVITDTAHGNIKLSMREEFPAKVNTNLLQCLPLGLVCSDTKAESDGELAPPHLECEHII